MDISSLLLRQLYTFGSLANTDAGYRFRLKNRLSPATLTGVAGVTVDGHPVPLERLTLGVQGGTPVAATAVSTRKPLDFPLRQEVEVRVGGAPLDAGIHHLALSFAAAPFGDLSFAVRDSIEAESAGRTRVPYDKDHNQSPDIVRRRQEFVEAFTGVPLRHVRHYSIDPAETQGNIENFTGVAQVPLGFAGPLRVNGEHARGDFLIPLATTEGTLVASYNRGMKVLNAAGGVSCTISDDCMQRAPVFVFRSAREARDFGAWVGEHVDEIRDVAQATSHVAKLRDIETYFSNKFAFLRFNFETGDAAGQNMVGRATFAACGWILDRQPHVARFYLESNLATDKKASQVNIMRTRGKRVTAEVTLPRRVVTEQLRVEPETVAYHAGIGTVGAVLSGANNNGAQSPNGITALFIATGQDVANVAESAAGIFYGEVTPEGDLYLSLTIPSLIVGTFGGGTGLPTQRECLEILGCRGPGGVRKLAEIIAGVALAGEISLAAAISSLDWVSSHEKYGRNR
jgi:hydroxymethylglutaryl-CoA reductase (NADPH)